MKSALPKNHFHKRTKTIEKHRLIYEKYHKCCLLPKTSIHHIDGNSLNNDPLNLMAFMNISKHKIYENNCKERICIKCNSNKTFIQKKTGFPQWHKFPNGFMCTDCWVSIGYPKIKDRGFVNPEPGQNKRLNETYSEMEIVVNSMNPSNSFTLKHRT